MAAWGGVAFFAVQAFKHFLIQKISKILNDPQQHSKVSQWSPTALQYNQEKKTQEKKRPSKG